MKKVAILSVLVLALATAAAAQNLTRFELNIFGGYGMSGFKGVTDYSDEWSSMSLTSVKESTAIDAAAKGGMFIGGGFAYYFHPNIGVGLSFGYHKGAVDTNAASSFYWRWSDGRSFTETQDYVGTDNYIQSMPISLNLIARFGQGRMQGFVQAGPTLFMNQVMLDSAILYGTTKVLWYIYPILYTQYVDALTIPMEVNEKWSAFGADFSGGFTFWLSPAFGINLEARYFFCPKKVFDWAFFTGTYDGTFFTNITNVEFSQDDVDYIYEEGLITSIEINPSFFQFGIGFKIRLY